jgi:hypothetical protein
VADAEIVRRIGPGDLVVTADIPLAALRRSRRAPTRSNLPAASAQHPPRTPHHRPAPVDAAISWTSCAAPGVDTGGPVAVSNARDTAWRSPMRWTVGWPKGAGVGGQDGLAIARGAGAWCVSGCVRRIYLRFFRRVEQALMPHELSRPRVGASIPGHRDCGDEGRSRGMERALRTRYRSSIGALFPGAGHGRRGRPERPCAAFLLLRRIDRRRAGGRARGPPSAGSFPAARTLRVMLARLRSPAPGRAAGRRRISTTSLERAGERGTPGPEHAYEFATCNLFSSSPETLVRSTATRAAGPWKPADDNLEPAAIPVPKPGRAR